MIPKTSTHIKNENSTINFNSFSSKILLKLEKKKLLEEYDKIYCQNKNMYVSKDSSLTIKDYTIKSKGIYNNVTIDYILDSVDNNYCSKIDAKELKYLVYPPLENNVCYIPDRFSHKENGTNYLINYECFGNLAFRTGLDKYNYFDMMLSYGWISIDTIINFLELQSEKGNGTTIQTNNSKAYVMKYFTFIKCDSKNNNANIYINNKKQINLKDYCDINES